MKFSCRAIDNISVACPLIKGISFIEGTYIISENTICFYEDVVYDFHKMHPYDFYRGKDINGVMHYFSGNIMMDMFDIKRDKR